MTTQLQALVITGVFSVLSTGAIAQALSRDQLGQNHNSVMDNLQAKLKDKRNGTYDACEPDAIALVKAQATSNPTLGLTTVAIDKGYAFRKANIVPGQSNTLDYAGLCAAQLSKATGKPILSIGEKELIEELFAELNAAKGFSNADAVSKLLPKLDAIDGKWRSKSYDWSKNEGRVSGYAISTAKYSFGHWRKLSDNEPNGPCRIAPWVAADVAGALGGAIGAGIDSYSHSGSVDWASVGAWALGGAVGASTLGPVGRLLNKFF